MNRRLLITGVTGFSGHHLAAAAHAEGWEVWGLSRSGRTVADVRTIAVDLGDPGPLERAVDDAAPDAVVHLAAQTPVNSPLPAEDSWLTGAPVGTLHLLNALQRRRPEARVLVVSSSAVYGHVPAAQLPVSEEQPLRPTTLYGVSKAAQELVAMQFCDAHRLAVVVARPFNLLGAGEPRGMVTSTLGAQVAAIAAGRAPAVVKLRHCATSRDFTDVRDAVNAYLALIAGGRPGVAYNVCSGVDVPLRALLDRMLAIAGITADVVETSAPVADDIARQVGSPRRVAAATGWRASIDLDDSLRAVLDSL